MWKIITLTGTLGHALIGTTSMIQAATQAEPVNWLLTAAAILGPGLFGLAATVLMILASRQPEVLVLPNAANEPGHGLSYPWR